MYQKQNQSPLPPNNSFNMIKQMTDMLKGKNNPEQMIQLLAQQNPQIANIMRLVNSNGGNAKDLFMREAQRKGIDPNQIISMLK